MPVCNCPRNRIYAIILLTYGFNIDLSNCFVVRLLRHSLIFVDVKLSIRSIKLGLILICRFSCVDDALWFFCFIPTETQRCCYIDWQHAFSLATIVEPFASLRNRGISYFHFKLIHEPIIHQCFVFGIYYSENTSFQLNVTHAVERRCLSTPWIHILCSPSKRRSKQQTTALHIKSVRCVGSINPHRVCCAYIFPLLWYLMSLSKSYIFDI